MGKRNRFFHRNVLNMELQQLRPSSALAPYIERYLLSHIDYPHSSPVLPDSSVVVGFQYGGQLSLEEGGESQPLQRLCLTGISQRLRSFRNEPGFGIILVYFRPWAAPLFFGSMMHEFYQQSVALNDFLSPAPIRQLEERLALSSSGQLRVELVETYLLNLLRPERADPLVRHSLERLKQTSGRLPIRELARQLFISPRQFEKRFRRSVGCTPKRWAAILRLRDAAQLLPGAASVSDVALNLGYYDQPHFQRAFKTFSGQTPAQYRARHR